MFQVLASISFMERHVSSGESGQLRSTVRLDTLPSHYSSLEQIALHLEVESQGAKPCFAEGK